MAHVNNNSSKAVFKIQQPPPILATFLEFALTERIRLFGNGVLGQDLRSSLHILALGPILFSRFYAPYTLKLCVWVDVGWVLKLCVWVDDVGWGGSGSYEGFQARARQLMFSLVCKAVSHWYKGHYFVVATSASFSCKEQGPHEAGSLPE